MNITDYLQKISQGEIPLESPDAEKDGIFGYTIKSSSDNHILYYRDMCSERGLWTIIDKIWTKELALWIGERSVLEVMAGGGWIAKALTTHNIDITATDNFSWMKTVHKYPPIFPVKNMEAHRAIKRYNRDILLISWPPYDDHTIIDICKVWGNKRPIIYIGEEYGCNAPEKFFDSFHLISPHPKFSFKQWWGLHDKIMIGYFE